MIENQITITHKEIIMFNKFIRKNNIKYYLILTGVLLFMFVGCSSSNLEKIKEKTKDIKKEDLDELKFS